MIALVVVEAVVLVVLSLLVVGLLRSYATVLRRLHDLEGGRQAPDDHQQPLPTPDFRTSPAVVEPRDPRSAAEWPLAHDIAGVGLDGEVITIGVVGVHHDTVLLFLSSGCAGCGSFWADLAHRNPLAEHASRLVVVTRGADAESPARLRELCPRGIDLVLSGRAWSDYQVPGSPYVMVVDGRSGRVRGEGSGTSLSQVSGLIRQSLDDAASQTAPRRATRKPTADYRREADVDRALLTAGIGPGHPSLYASESPTGSATP